MAFLCGLPLRDVALASLQRSQLLFDPLACGRQVPQPPVGCGNVRLESCQGVRRLGLRRFAGGELALELGQFSLKLALFALKFALAREPCSAPWTGAVHWTSRGGAAGGLALRSADFC